jgi:UDP-glucose:(heptosyl)LPS alpha-1,3-glucosyltransferase
MVKRDLIACHGVPESSIEVIHNGVDLRRFNPTRRTGTGAALRESLGWGRQHTVLLFLGRGFGRKGLDRLLEAFASVVPSRPELRLLVVGRDRGRPAYERQAKSLGLSRLVHFTGEVEDPEVCYGAADLYVLPARYDPFAFSVLEALATGLPVITTDRTGASELLDESVGSIVSADGGADELADALLHWTEPGRAAQAAAAARARAERHPFEGTLSATEAVLMRAAATRPAAAPSAVAATR